MSAKNLRVAILIAIVMLTASLASAGTIYSNFGPGHSHVPNVALPVSDTWFMGMWFTAAISGSVSQIDVAMVNFGGPTTANVSLWTTVNYYTLDTQIGSWTLNNFIYSIGCCGYTSITGITGPEVTAGQRYYLVVEGASGSDLGWVMNSTGQGPVIYSSDAGAHWTGWSITPGAFEVIAADVPEPMSLMLLGSGLAGLLPVVRRKSA